MYNYSVVYALDLYNEKDTSPSHFLVHAINTEVINVWSDGQAHLGPCRRLMPYSDQYFRC